MRNESLRRRRFLQVAASGAAVTVSCGGQKSRWRFFTNAESVTLAALCDTIIPPDQDPGASQAGVVDFIDRQLSGFHRKLAHQYRSGLKSLAALGFNDKNADDRAAILSAIEARKLGDAGLRSFVDLAVNHTMQGFYGNPRHGGNKNWASWKMLGVPVAPVRGRSA